MFKSTPTENFRRRFHIIVIMLNKAYIDLSAIRSNALAVKRKLKKTTKLCAVVKADAYGHGAPKVCSALHNIADCFAVATAEEGIELRLSGENKEVLVLTALFKGDVERAVFYSLTPTVCSTKDVTSLERECEKQGKNICVHVKVNTGMNRQGVEDLEELERVLKCISRQSRVKLGGAYSHFAFPENKKSLLAQQNKFLLANNLVKRYNNKAICHISASGGFLSGVECDMVRIGILLYGYLPFTSDYISVKPAMKIYAPVLKSFSLNKGDSALYGKLIAKENLDLSLIRYGYADGLMRKKTSGQFNNRCMDITAIRLKGKAGKLVPVMINADALAKEYETISYEILTKSAFRAEKIYIN